MSAKIEDYFHIESKVNSTRFAEFYKAQNRSTREAVSLWILKKQFEIGSEEAKQFLDRLQKIDLIEPAVSGMLAYGVDSDGKGFTVFPQMSGNNILTVKVDYKETERRLMAILQAVSRLHENGIIVGDFTADTFFVDREGKINFQGLLGYSEKNPIGAEDIWEPFCAPESVSPLEKFYPQSDVFAIGVLAYKMFTGKLPTEILSERGLDLKSYNELPKASELVRNLPVWVDEVLQKCLNSNYEDRYANAQEIMSAISAAKEADTFAQNVPQKTTAIRKEINEPNLLSTSHLRASYETSANKEEPVKKSYKLYVAAAAAVVVLLVAGVVAREMFFKQKSDLLSLELKDRPDLQESTQVITKGDASFGSKLKEIQKLSTSIDPVAHSMLVKLATSSSSPELQQAAELGLLERARRGGLRLTAMQIEQSLRGSKTGQLSDYYARILNLLDSSLPINERKKILSDLQKQYPDLVLNLAAAQAFDLDRLEEFQSIFIKLVRLPEALAKNAKITPLTLLLQSEDVSLIFADEFLARRDSLTNDELHEVLKTLARRNDVNVRAFANAAIERKSISPVALDLLKIVRDRNDVPSNIVYGIVRGALGDISDAELQDLSRWVDHQSQVVLLSLLSIEKNLARQAELFDALSSKLPTNHELSPLVSWVRNNAWEDRVKFIPLIGKLAYAKNFKADEFKEEMKVVDPYVEDPNLAEAILNIDQPVIVHAVVLFAPEMLSLQEKLNLLKNEDKAVKLAAIRSITTNDIGALKMVMDHFDKEQDPEVKAAYRDNFWALKDRK